MSGLMTASWVRRSRPVATRRSSANNALRTLWLRRASTTSNSLTASARSACATRRPRHGASSLPNDGSVRQHCPETLQALTYEGPRHAPSCLHGQGGLSVHPRREALQHVRQPAENASECVYRLSLPLDRATSCAGRNAALRAKNPAAAGSVFGFTTAPYCNSRRDPVACAPTFINARARLVAKAVEEWGQDMQTAAPGTDVLPEVTTREQVNGTAHACGKPSRLPKPRWLGGILRRDGAV
jgi:hypothetical protein